jgi:hypothetical protein
VASNTVLTHRPRITAEQISSATKASPLAAGAPVCSAMKLQEPEHAAVGKLNAHQDMLKLDRVSDQLRLRRIAAINIITTKRLIAKTSSWPLIVT